MTSGWAIKVDHELDIKTVGPTARSAMVNYLWNAGHMLTNSTTDRQIEALFADEQKIKAGRIELTRVRIAEQGGD